MGGKELKREIDNGAAHLSIYLFNSSPQIYGNSNLLWRSGIEVLLTSHILPALFFRRRIFYKLLYKSPKVIIIYGKEFISSSIVLTGNSNLQRCMEAVICGEKLQFGIYEGVAYFNFLATNLNSLVQILICGEKLSKTRGRWTSLRRGSVEANRL